MRFLRSWKFPSIGEPPPRRSRGLLATSILVALVALPFGAMAGGRTEALLVGVGKYKYAGAASGFEALEGPANDIADLKHALCAGYGVCRPTILLDGQATRAAILRALWSMVDGMTRDGKPAPAGATLLFYYSGHGGQYEDTVGDQNGAPDSTLVPYDGRGPDATPDVLDRELNVIIKEANLRGINVVTVFDSCNSGTATRGFDETRIRRAPLAKGPPPPTGGSHAEPSAYARVPGYRVHLAAAPDGDSALEVKIDGVWRGLFTAALTSAMSQEPHGVTYRDLMAEAELKLSQIGAPQQIWLGRDVPTGAKGLTASPLTDVASDQDLDAAFLGAAKSPTAVYEAVPSNDATVLTVDGGRLTGVTAGSVFDIYALRDQALVPSARAIARGRIVQAGAAIATLRLSGPAPKPTGDTFYLREVAHDYGAQTLKVAIQAPSASDKDNLALYLKQFPAAEVVESHPQIVLRPLGDGIRFETEGGARLADADIDRMVGGVPAPFANLAKFAKYFEVLSLKDASRSDIIAARLSKTDCHRGNPVAFDLDGGTPVLRPGGAFYVLLTRRPEAAGELTHVYILDLGPDFSIKSFFPVELAPDQCAAQQFTATSVVGVNYVVILATDRAIDVGALQQNGVRSALPPEASPLEQLLANANAGVRSAPTPVDVGAWGAKVLTFRTATAADTSQPGASQ